MICTNIHTFRSNACQTGDEEAVIFGAPCLPGGFDIMLDPLRGMFYKSSPLHDFPPDRHPRPSCEFTFMGALPQPESDQTQERQTVPKLRLMVVKNDYFWKDWDHDALHAEHVNVVTHGFGCGAGLVAGIFLCSQAWLKSSLPVFAACLVYSLTMMGVYLASTLSHSLFTARWRDRFRIIDQLSIFLFIAGSFTPYAVCLLPLNGWIMLLPATWLLALSGVGYKLFVTRRELVPYWYYMLTGWFPALSLIHISSLLPWAGLFWILAGGVSYTIGVYYYVNDHRTIYHHGMWHIWVMLGTACHYISIYCYVVPLAHV